MNRPISIWAAPVFVTIGAKGQAYSATWPLLKPQQQAGVGTGAVTVSPESIGPGPAPSLVIDGHNTTGQLGSSASIRGRDGW